MQMQNWIKSLHKDGAVHLFINSFSVNFSPKQCFCPQFFRTWTFMRFQIEDKILSWRGENWFLLLNDFGFFKSESSRKLQSVCKNCGRKVCVKKKCWGEKLPKSCWRKAPKTNKFYARKLPNRRDYPLGNHNIFYNKWFDAE